MDISVYEAAAAYDRRSAMEKGSQTWPLVSAVFDLDTYGLGLCRCEKGGAPELLASCQLTENRGYAEDFMHGLHRMVEDVSSEELEKDLRSQMEDINTKLRTYFKTKKQTDEQAIFPLGREAQDFVAVQCSELEEAAAEGAKKLEQMTVHLDGFLEEKGIDEDDVRIILCGKLGDFYLTQYILKRQLSFDPFIADDRFVNAGYADRPDNIAALGRQILQEEDVMGVGISVKVLGIGDSEEVQYLPLCSKDQPKTSFSDPVFTGPIFAGSQDALTFRIESEGARELNIPVTGLVDDAGFVETGIIISEGSPSIRVRSVEDPSKIHNVVVAKE